MDTEAPDARVQAAPPPETSRGATVLRHALAVVLPGIVCYLGFWHLLGAVLVICGRHLFPAWGVHGVHSLRAFDAAELLGAIFAGGVLGALAWVIAGRAWLAVPGCITANFALYLGTFVRYGGLGRFYWIPLVGLLLGVCWMALVLPHGPLRARAAKKTAS